jgi:hypothetical protein
MSLDFIRRRLYVCCFYRRGWAYTSRPSFKYDKTVRLIRHITSAYLPRRSNLPMKSLFSKPVPCAAPHIEQPLLETAIMQKQLAKFIVVANRAQQFALDHAPDVIAAASATPQTIRPQVSAANSQLSERREKRRCEPFLDGSILH